MACVDCSRLISGTEVCIIKSISGIKGLACGLIGNGHRRFLQGSDGWSALPGGPVSDDGHHEARGFQVLGAEANPVQNDGRVGRARAQLEKRDVVVDAVVGRDSQDLHHASNLHTGVGVV